jgi:hypothetical protein
MKQDAVYLKPKIKKKWVTTNIDRNNEEGKVGNDTVGKPLMLNKHENVCMEYIAFMQVIHMHH